MTTAQEGSDERKLADLEHELTLRGEALAVLEPQLKTAGSQIEQHKRAFLELVKTNGEKHRRLEAAERKLADLSIEIRKFKQAATIIWEGEAVIIDVAFALSALITQFSDRALAQIEPPEPQENFAGLAACRAEQVNSQPVKTNQCKYCNGLGFVSTPDANNVRCPICSGAGNQFEQPQSTPTNHVSAHPPALPEEIQELKDEAADWQRQFHAMKAQCETNGFTVRYGDDGMPVLKAPNQYLTGDDPPFECCQCPACLAIRAAMRNQEHRK